MNESYVYIKALHIAAVVCWFAGLFYMVRLFIYHVEADSRPEHERKLLQEQFQLMQKRLWLGITVPSMWAALSLGGHLIAVTKWWNMPWFHVKATLVVLLVLYHLQCGRLRKQLSEGVCKWSSGQLRLFNEGATVLLFAIVFAVVTKDPLMTLKAMLGFMLFAFVLVWLFREKLQGQKK